ncbi:MAG: hypothetical protein M3R50_09055, partial [Bacteroidota bacterium]|nr:hypothetical protein [Bacteroidota bacterium]
IDFEGVKEADAFLDYAFARSKKMGLNESCWTCDICDGDNETGCQYFDPSECPKFKNRYS